MPNISREDIERIFRQKLAELNHVEIIAKREFSAVVDACLKYFIESGKIPEPYSTIVKIVELISNGMIRSAISQGIGAALGLSITFDTVRATHAAMEDVLKWLDKTNEQDPKKIGYIIDEYIRYWSFYFAEDYYLEDPTALKQFEPDLAFKKYNR